MIVKYLIFMLLLALLVIPPILWRRAAFYTQADAQKARARRMMGKERKREAERLLGLRENATEKEVRMAHLMLMKKYHPDKGGSKDAAARINAAKDILLDRVA
jgi:hypothetical protein